MKIVKKRVSRRPSLDTGEFLWLVSLSDLMILLFILFVVLFSAAHKKMKQSDYRGIASALRNEAPAADPIDTVQNRLREWVEKQKLQNLVSVVKADDAVLLHLNDRVLFESGGFALKAEGAQAIRTLVSTLELVPAPYQIGIEGHTDDLPVRSNTVQDNWDLSSKRCLAVMRTLDLPEKVLARTVLMAFGEKKPLFPNRDAHGNPIPENQARNRRVTLRIF